ncbi:rhodanese-like domain-containing protein [Halorarum salinum]|uniref:Rhodanese-like domain-containing protein n=1 Tax=Halorarum salinum TaxID=2743089 RepID=A0A7D5LDW3_9EURY|nr:rhodanese-like domain-containing protein [Halobaculum salinum]QLG63689.1 rhodanese-like domain-containing protein [Halobaculum salinum]
MVEEITTEDVKAKVDAGEDVQIIDIRDPDQFAAGHVPGAVNVPMSELPSRVDEIEWGDDVVVACPIGQSSVQAARLIGSYEGVEDDDAVRSMAGGYDAWEYELESDE